MPHINHNDRYREDREREKLESAQVKKILWLIFLAIVIAGGWLLLTLNSMGF